MSMTGAGAEVEMDDGYERVFNSEAFSDLVLRIEVVGPHDDGLGSGTAVAIGGSRSGHKRRREDHGSTVPSPVGADGEGIDSPTVLRQQVLRVNTVYVSSAILAAKSDYFYKLFLNGMNASGLKLATVRIADSEERAFMELLSFMYNGKLTQIDATLLVHMLTTADKFEVVSCVKLCGQRLTGLAMTTELAVMRLDLPNSFSVAAELTEAAKAFLAARYAEFWSTNFQDELVRIPLAGVEAILSRSDLGAVSEEDVYEFLLRWARLQYPDSEERHQILSSRLLPLLCVNPVNQNATGFPVEDDLYSDPPCRTVGFNLKRGECSKFGHRYLFYFAGPGSDFLVHHTRLTDCSGFTFHMLDVPTRIVDYEIEVQTTPSLEFVTMHRGSTPNLNCEAVGNNCTEAVAGKDFFGIPLEEFIAEDSPFFIENMLNLRVNVEIKQML